MQLDPEDGQEKQAGGEIFGRLAELLSYPFLGHQRGQAINRAVQQGLTTAINKPAEWALRKSRLPNLIGKAVEVGMTPIPHTPKLLMPVMDQPQRAALGQRVAEGYTNLMANNPEALLIPSPDPISGKAYIGAKKLFGKAIGARSLLEKKAMWDAFSDEMEKIANQFPGFITDIDEATTKNTNYRKVLHTAPREQLVAMSLPSGGDIGTETHPHTDQFIRVEGGHGKAVLDGSARGLHNGTALIIPSGTQHNVVNTGKTPLKLYTVYSKQEHPDGIVEKTKADAKRMEKDANGDMLQYFQNHPEKLKEKRERDRKKEKQAEDLEAAYWNFDSRMGRQGGEYAGRPQSERDAFKSAVTPLLEKIAQVAPYQQNTQWTCSAACLKAVLGHYNHDIPEELAVQAIGTRPNRGAECDEIVRGAHKFGFDAFEFSFDSLEQAKWLLDQDIPIIADIQSFNHPGKGHYVVITSIDDQGVHMMDPNTDGNERTISHEEMEERWWDRAMAPPHDMMPKWGIVILPPESP